MGTFIKILGYISGPLIGAVIGYFTNYLAVKMLFRPYKPKKIGKWTLPFTPGIIPKRQPQLAKAVGKAVGEQLFTGEDIKNVILTNETKQKIATSIIDSVYKEKTIEGIATTFADQTKVQLSKETVVSILTDKISGAASKMDVGSIVAQQGGSVIKAKKSSLGMLALLLDDSIIDSLFSQIGTQINDYVEKNGNALFTPFIEREVEDFSKKDLEYIIPKEKCEKIILTFLDKVFLTAIDGILKELDISSVVEEKVNAMDMRELEQLCMSVMKKELNAVVNLGAVLGFLIGIINIFI